MLLALACSRTTEPQPEAEGRITLRFEKAPDAALVARDGATPFGATAAIDTVVVRVFRSGTPITQEASRVVDISDGSVDISIPCIAENGKRVSVDLYEGGKFTHHGFETGVNVVKGEQTAVSIDAYSFTVSSLVVTPGLATDPEPFDLTWDSAPAATRYDVQVSTSSDFGVIEWEQSVTDTFVTAQLSPGPHHFRVVPRTDFAQGLSCPEQFAYVQSTSQDVVITGFSVPAAKPADVITIFGENLDYPGTQVWIGSMQMQVVSWSWGAIDARIPRAAYTESISVSSTLGSDTRPFVVQRVAYVTDGGVFAPGYITALEKHDDDFGFSGVALLTVEDLDTQDMDVFDVVVVAQDTGNSLSNWGGGVPTRANAIANTGANVLAMGRGGAVFLQLVGATSAPHQTTPDTDGDYYAPDGSEPIFTTPHSIGGGFITFNGLTSPTTTSFNLASAPAGANLYASTDCARLVVCTGPNNQWVLADFRFDNPGGIPVVYFFWGYADDSEELTSQGTDVLGNVMYMLYRARAVPPIETSDRSPR
jgi:hypothetical protein